MALEDGFAALSAVLHVYIDKDRDRDDFIDPLGKIINFPYFFVSFCSEAGLHHTRKSDRDKAGIDFEGRTEDKRGT